MNIYTHLEQKQNSVVMTIIEIRPFRNGWQVFEAPGVQPVFLSQEQAIDYASGRACFRSGEIRILDSTEPLRALFHSMKWIEGLIGLLDDQAHSLASFGFIALAFVAAASLILSLRIRDPLQAS
jgi:hypothetical protein